MLNVSASSIRSHYPDAVWRRGLSYAEGGRVARYQASPLKSGTVVTAEVRGSKRQPYSVSVTVPASGTGFRSRCNCPLEVDCKHAAAVLWYALGETGDSGSVEAMLDTLRRLREEIDAEPAVPDPTPAPPTRRGDHLVFLLDAGAEQGAPMLLRPMLAARDGDQLKLKRELQPGRLLAEDSRAIGPDEVLLLQGLKGCPSLLHRGKQWFRLDEADVDALLSEALRTHRLYLHGAQVLPLRAGDPRPLSLVWQADRRGDQRLETQLQPSADQLLKARATYYLDRKRSMLGRVDSGFTDAEISELMALPALTPETATSGWRQLFRRFGRRLQPPTIFPVVEVKNVEAEPVLLLSAAADRDGAINRRIKRRLGYAKQYFDVQGERLDLAQAEQGWRIRAGDVVERAAIDPGFMAECADQLLEEDLYPAEGFGHATQTDWLINPDDDENTLKHFCLVGVPALKARGWRIEYAPGFPVGLIETTDEWFADAIPVDNQWFGFKLGIVIDGSPIDLLPTLARHVQAGVFDQLPPRDGALVSVELDDGRRIPVPAGRLRLILETLTELGATFTHHTMRLTRHRAGSLRALELGLGDVEFNWGKMPDLEVLATQLQRFDGVEPLQPPTSFHGTLRPYQAEGVGWLDFLRTYGLGGCLADDMGLGKTVQLLAFLLREREAGRLKHPALVVAPTSVLPNWQREAERFAPDLKVLVWSGAKRAGQASALADAELVLTSYPLLGRDIKTLSALEFSMLALDESQLVKNPNTLAARAARQVRAPLRLCLTGTPLENHLGELWAQYDFLMPGFLGSRTQFNKQFRVPIERRRDRAVAARLKARLRPFLLRRSKDEVVKELPPKVLITRAIELEGKQRDLYETLRASLSRDLQATAAERGIERSRMQLLDGLLKLRQICCDPRLLPVESAQHIEQSAKLSRLLVMIESLLSEGRRMLIFSQFTSMLALIERALIQKKIRYVILTGQTEDRDTPVQRFQSLEVPVFLISLKAGGFGLNLTAADTVIHYDPWWNPAVEAQATDRAYRIGQDKPVFVYRLIAAGTVEERIHELQQRKQALADELLDDADLAAPSGFSAEDLLGLLQD